MLGFFIENRKIDVLKKLTYILHKFHLSYFIILMTTFMMTHSFEHGSKVRKISVSIPVFVFTMSSNQI